jgi:hypothetical protein
MSEGVEEPNKEKENENEKVEPTNIDIDLEETINLKFFKRENYPDMWIIEFFSILE